MNKYIPKLIRAAINNDRKSIESLSLMIGRELRKTDLETSQEIMRILACNNSGVDTMRSINLSNVPIDKETRSRLVNLEEPITIKDPILSDVEMDVLNQFIQERSLLDKFLEEDIAPPNSMLLYGKPGVGKTYISKWLSYKLDIPMVVLDLANAISSYLGRSGQNIKSIFQYIKGQKVILFLDEIDAIAKKRDDITDLGELKRLVNVLLKELEECSINCVVIGATNHPELLDRAIWRRFDRNLEITMPKKEQRKLLFKRGMGSKYEEIDEETIQLMIEGTEQMSAADICKMCEHIKRKMIINPENTIIYCMLREYCEFAEIKTKEQKVKVCKKLKSNCKNISINKIAELTGIPTSSVDRYLKE